MPERQEFALAVSDPSQLSSLHDWLRGQRDVEVAVTPGVPGAGEQGALDVLTVLASSGGLIAAIRVLPEYIRSRRSGFRIETTVRGERLMLDATNVDDVLPVLERLLRD
ncbi:effector-associated constant component EACC1 [Streptomyces mirabilis]|uniref:effector-associated constant component EACC1 n=1 Tax=Streptomyces mirabilis TaxID=68239 RepID=UPI00365931CD